MWITLSEAPPGPTTQPPAPPRRRRRQPPPRRTAACWALDQLLLERFAAECAADLGVAPAALSAGRPAERLRAACEKARQDSPLRIKRRTSLLIASLVSRIRTPITLTALPVARLRPSVRGRARGPPGDADARATLTREELETLAAPLLARVQEACVTALSKAGVASRSTVHSVELVGGLSRMPALQAAVADAVGRPVARTLIAEESVARVPHLLPRSCPAS